MMEVTSTGIHSSAFHLQKGITPQPVMTHHDDVSPEMEPSEKEKIHLLLPGLLPENHKLVLNPVKRIVVLLYDEPGGESHSVNEHQFPPSGMRILIPLLLRYPDYCTYEVLLANLYTISVEEARKQLHEARDTTLRPLRRAIVGIAADLRSFGLRVTSVRSTGYILKRV
jgi:hypothetical protein